MNITNFKEYRELAAVTDNPDNLIRFENHWHYLGGIFTEITELRYATCVVNRDEEIGDILWYLARYVDIIGNDIDYLIDDTFEVELPNNNLEATFFPNINGLYSHLSEIVNYQKRHMAYGEEFKRHEVEICLHHLLIYLRNCTNKSFKQICEANIRKLANRKQFAEKFNAHFGSVRDTQAEYDILTNSFL